MREGELITQKDAVAILGVTKQRVSAMVKAKRLKTKDIAGVKFLIRSEVQAYERSKGGRPKIKKGEQVETMSDICKCEHAIDMHSSLYNRECLRRDCKCDGFKLSEKTEVERYREIDRWR